MGCEKESAACAGDFLSILSYGIMQCFDKCRGSTAASSDNGRTVFDQYLHVGSEILWIHAVHGISPVINRRHACVWLGNDRNRDIFLNTSYNGYKLIRSDRAVDTNGVCTGCLKRNCRLDGIAAAEDTSICFNSHGTHDWKVAYRICGIYSCEGLFDIDHSFGRDQIDAGICEDLNLFLIHFESVIISIVAVSGDKRTGSCDVPGYIDSVSGKFSGISDQCAVDLFNPVRQPVLGKI